MAVWSMILSISLLLGCLFRLRASNLLINLSEGMVLPEGGGVPEGEKCKSRRRLDHHHETLPHCDISNIFNGSWHYSGITTHKAFDLCPQTLSLVNITLFINDHPR